MELTKQQIRKINDYIVSCGIKHYDVRAEIVDHFSSILERKLVENPNLNLKEEIIKIHKNFSKIGFSEFIKSKEKTVTKKFYKSLYHHLKTFFKLPKILITISVFYGLLYVMNLFTDKESFFNYIRGFAICIVLQLLYRIKSNSTDEKFLLLDRTKTFFILTYFMFFIGIYQTVDYRSNESFQNPTHNIIVLGFFVLCLFVYWSGEYVYFQNRKEIKQQFPTVTF